jgi:hypothetical protein
MRLALVQQKRRFHEPSWHVLLAIAVIIVLQLVLNSVLTLGLKYVLVALEVLLLVGLVSFPVRTRRILAITLMALISIVNIVSLCLVIYLLFVNTHIDGRDLLISAVAIYITNIVIFGLWYWELDNTRVRVADFQFPQSISKGVESVWRPTFFDYLYISITNATAFSPTDTLPLTHRAKVLMAIQAVASLVTIALVAARAVNILS